jgi:hypothetical protein
MYRAVSDTLRSLPKQDADLAIHQMARELARLLDAGSNAGDGAGAYHKLAPRLVGVLRELGATPAARRSNGRGEDGDGPTPGERADLDELGDLQRAARDRAYGAAGVDSPAPGADA